MKKINKNDFIGTVELEKNKIINEEIKPFNFKVKLKLDNNSKKFLILNKKIFQIIRIHKKFLKTLN